jgi:excisionase family DNA binding protein
VSTESLSQTVRPLLLDVPAAAEYLGVGERFVRRLIAERRLPHHHLGRHVRIAVCDLQRFVELGRVEAT